MDKDVRTTDLRTCHDSKFFPGGYYFYVSADDLMIQDYYVQDYQGNNRMVVHQYMGSDFVGQTTHYYRRIRSWYSNNWKHSRFSY